MSPLSLHVGFDIVVLLGGAGDHDYGILSSD